MRIGHLLLLRLGRLWSSVQFLDVRDGIQYGGVVVGVLAVVEYLDEVVAGLSDRVVARPAFEDLDVVLVEGGFLPGSLCKTTRIVVDLLELFLR
ncbi:hypothetical protein [Amycolatopsis sp. SID8362]|uniref:hypothetical protein n=1 Tax=Amycolatopsis sp. SID8362 TaxID=2690346 RepID=UPI00136E713D|nr:hypothetical protein [Amycolatopsis sp. SID8362]NBH06081.1 hypothetical protein [Amycolatopsis sp. SID8362]NED42780.1 hypothetical protein [Amycolatopsis sp. SID8362]